MRVVCIDNIQRVFGSPILLALTLHKIYQVVDYSDGAYIVIDDAGEECPYSGFRFKKLEDVRNDKINKILNDELL